MSTEAKAIQKKKMKAPPLILLVLGLIIVVNSLRAYFAAQRGAESQPAKS